MSDELWRHVADVVAINGKVSGGAPAGTFRALRVRVVEQCGPYVRAVVEAKGWKPPDVAS